MAGKHHRGIVAAGRHFTWTGDLSESPERSWFTAYVEPDAPAWPERDEDLETIRAEASRVAIGYGYTRASREALFVVLDGLARL